METKWLEPYLQQLRTFEKFIPNMYRDSARKQNGTPLGFVTIGYGTNLEAMQSQELAVLKLRYPESPQVKVPPHVIRESIARVKKMDFGMATIAYKYHESGYLEISEIEAERLMVKKVQEVIEALSRRYHGFLGFPDDARFALIDMAYNLGMAGLEKYQRLHRAIGGLPYRNYAPDWLAVAAESFRHGPGPSRNHWTKRSFERAGWHAPLIYRGRKDVDFEMRALETHRKKRT